MLANVDFTVVISLPRKKCAESAIARIKKIPDWPFPAPIEFCAINTVTASPASIPQIWRSRGGRYIGLYGCLLSHRAVLETYKGTVLILEDDAIFCKDFPVVTRNLFSQIPSDWDAVALGGNILPAKGFVDGRIYPAGKIDPATFRASGIKDTVAYIATDAYRKKLLALNQTEEDRWGLLWTKFQEESKFYAAQPWLVTQAPGWSHCRQMFTS